MSCADGVVRCKKDYDELSNFVGVSTPFLENYKMTFVGQDRLGFFVTARCLFSIKNKSRIYLSIAYVLDQKYVSESARELSQCLELYTYDFFNHLCREYERKILFLVLHVAFIIFHVSELGTDS